MTYDTWKATEPEPPRQHHRHRLAKGLCRFCDEHGDDDMMPSHDASERCESGGHNHCTCGVCFD